MVAGAFQTHVTSAVFWEAGLEDWCQRHVVHAESKCAAAGEVVAAVFLEEGVIRQSAALQDQTVPSAGVAETRNLNRR